MTAPVENVQCLHQGWNKKGRQGLSDRMSSLLILGARIAPNFFSSLFHHFLYTHSLFYREDVRFFMKKVKNLLICFFIAFGFSSSSFVFATPNPTDARMQQMILHYINEYRAKHHLAPLKLNASASLEAARHSQAMANKTIPFGHAHFQSRIKHLYNKFEDARGGAENVAYYRMNAKRLVDGWIASPGHRRNIEGNYNVTGIGIAHGKPGWGYFTQIFVLTNNKKYS